MPTPAAARLRRYALPVVLLAAVLAGLFDISLFRILFAHPGNDQAWLLYAAGQWLHGTTLYGSQLIETNPPLIVWVSALPMQLALWLHADPIFILRVLTTGLALGSVAWCLRLLNRAQICTGLAASCLWGLGLLAAELAQHGNDYGQKEHLLILLLLPYLLYAALDLDLPLRLSLPERLSLAVAAGCGVCLKPQDALILVPFSLFLMLVDWPRLLRPESLAILLTCSAYVFAIQCFAPLYLHQTVPLLRNTYWAFAALTPLQIVADHGLFNLLFVAAIVLWLLLRSKLRAPHMPPALIAACLGAVLAFAQQAKNWPYQFYPQLALLACALGWPVLERLTALLRVTLRDLSSWLLPALAALLVVISLPPLLHMGRTHDKTVSQTPDSAFLDATLAGLPPGTSVDLLSINLMGTSDIVADRLTLAGRYNHLWMLPAIVLNERAQQGGPAARHPLSPERTAQLAALLRSNVADDLTHRTPEVILVPHCKATTAEPCQGLWNTDFDILAWFQRDPGFTQAFAPYRRMAGDDFFDVYRRMPR